MLLVGSLLAVIGFARAGSVVFWKCEAERGEPEPRRQDGARALVRDRRPGRGPRPARALFAGPVMTAMDATPGSCSACALHRGRAGRRHRSWPGAEIMANRFLPHPLLSLTLAVIWIALANEVSAG